MKDDRTKYSFTDAANEELTFLKEDREEVFRKIRQAETKKVHTAARSLFSVSRKLAPLTISLLMIGLSLFLFFPSLFDSTGIETNGTAPIGEAAPQKEDEGYFTALFSIKDEEDRLPLNLLLAYNRKQKRMNILSIMRDTHMEMPNNDDPDAYKKLSHAYLNGSKGAESVKAAVSDLFDLPIDYYAVMDLETFSAAVDSVDGIVYDLQGDITVRAVSQVAFELEKGSRNLSGEEVVALLMDATEEKSFGAEDQLNLINAVIDQTINELSAAELKRFTAEMESNIPEEQLFWSGLDQFSVQLLTLSDGMQNTMIDETFYIEFDEEFLHGRALELTTFDTAETVDETIGSSKTEEEQIRSSENDSEGVSSIEAGEDDSDELASDEENTNEFEEGQTEEATEYTSEQIEYARVWHQLGVHQEIDELNVLHLPKGTPMNPNDDESGVYPVDVIHLSGSRLVDGSITYSGNGDGTINVYNVPHRWDGDYTDTGKDFYEEIVNTAELVAIAPTEAEEIKQLIELITVRYQN